jgi:uncharacterized phage protein gp47/JayE
LPIDLYAFRVKSSSEFQDDMSAYIVAGRQRRGISNPVIDTNQELTIGALANQCAFLCNNAAVKANANMPDTATGSDLDRVAANYGLTRKNAGGSVGYLVLVHSQPGTVLIAEDEQLLDPNGLRFEVSQGGAYNSGTNVPIRCIDTGARTNLSAGTVLRWLSPPAFVASKVLVSDTGTTGGVDAENDETLRARLLARLGTPTGSGNWSHLAEMAEDSDLSVEKAFVYPYVNGGSTAGVAVTRMPSSVNKGRDVDSLTLNNRVIPTILGQAFESTSLIITTVANLPTSVSVALALPASPQASPAGPGGGWKDGAPFPTPTSDGYCKVTVVNSSTEFRVLSDSPPVDGVSRICWLSLNDYQVKRATVLSSTDDGYGAYTVTISTPFVDLFLGAYICPDAENMDRLFEAFLEAFATMGPGEKLNPAIVAGVFPRAYRKPKPSEVYPQDLGPRFLRHFSDASDAVLDVAWLYRQRTSPGYPPNVLAAPYILTPLNLGLYPLV